MAKILESLIAKGRRAKRPPEQKEVAFGLADLSTHEELLERLVQKGFIFIYASFGFILSFYPVIFVLLLGGVKSLLALLTKSPVDLYLQYKNLSNKICKQKTLFVSSLSPPS